MKSFLLLASVLMYTTTVSCGWDFIKDFFHGTPSSSSSENEEDQPNTQYHDDGLHAARYHCPPHPLEHLSSGGAQEVKRFADRPERCGCPEGMQRCAVGDWYVCVNKVGLDGKPQRCPKY